MFKNFGTLFIFFIVHLQLCSSGIIETASFSEVEHYLTSDSLLILDIDDTLLIPVQMLGCDEWFNLRLEAHKNSGLDYKKALEKTLAEWESVRHITKMEIVEPQTDETVRNLQDKGYSIMGLTTQGLALATRTSQQLLENGIALFKTAPSREDHYFLIDHHGVLYRNGILFTSGSSKGASLSKLCQALHLHPERIVFINDKEAHLKDVESYALKAGIEFIGLRYNYSDARKRTFSPEIANFQFRYSSFAKILSDEEAAQQMDFFAKRAL